MPQGNVKQVGARQPYLRQSRYRHRGPLGAVWRPKPIRNSPLRQVVATRAEVPIAPTESQLHTEYPSRLRVDRGSIAEAVSRSLTQGQIVSYLYGG